MRMLLTIPITEEGKAAAIADGHPAAHAQAQMSRDDLQ